MNKSNLNMIARTILMNILIVLLIGGCSPPPIKLATILGSAEHHVYNGFKLLEKGMKDDAEREFKHAMELDREYSAAYQGMGILYGISGEFHSAFKSMEQARQYARNEKEKGFVHVGIIRLYTMKRGADWLENAESSFLAAKSLSKGMPDAYYYMGLAYKFGFRFDDSEKAFQKVKEIDRGFVPEARRELMLLHKISRAMPETTTGKRVVVLAHISRADVAALFIDELRLAEIYDKARNKGIGTPSSSPPHKAIPNDTVNHPLQDKIEKALVLNIDGLRVSGDGAFAPDRYVTRADYAVMLVGMMERLDKGAFESENDAAKPSPFRDVSEDAPYFNAVMKCVLRGGIMAPKAGYFKPMDLISGVDSLLSLKKIKKELRIP